VYVHVSYDLHLSVHIHLTALQMYLAITTVSWTCGGYAVMVGGFKWQCILHARLRNNTVLQHSRQFTCPDRWLRSKPTGPSP